ncbi:MAG TPA: proline--tRNA ligase [Burkholderiaceae bacterium]|nr:proline--tRNA ligase [Burkholderiaceae bacterium]
MKASRFLVSTLKEAPADAEVVSHRLMTRAGMIKRLAGGIYTYMPMGLRTIRKVETIIREEMNRAGAIELLMPVIQPAELWQESGRWEQYGPELMRIRDRHERDFIVQPTSEEVITDVARQEIRSYRQMPRNLYHIQTKFRDERRPRFGVMRGREFTMKDAYSFDRSPEAALASYRAMFDAYVRIFERMGLEFRAVAADTGAIGGSASHEFQVIADTGEDAIAWCPDSGYAANVELAEALPLIASRAAPAQALEKTPTPGKARCEDVAELLGLPLERTVKSLVLAVDELEPAREGEAADAPRRVTGTSVWLLLVRGDHELNEIKAGKVPGLAGFRFATEAEIVAHFGCRPGYLGPIGTARAVRLVVDRTVANMSDFVCGANAEGFHFTGVNWGRDLPLPGGDEVRVADLRNVVDGDPSPDGAGRLSIQRGIEVGHVFYLGTKYSAAMNAVFVDEDGKSKPIEMGCYGIGVTRLPAAAIEQNHDEKGIVWPRPIAPFDVVVTPLGYSRSEAVRTAADALYDRLLEAGIDVVLDDRDERPGAMFADWELIGVPLRVTVGDRGLKEGKVELTVRRGLVTTLVPLEGAFEAVKDTLDAC